MKTLFKSLSLCALVLVGGCVTFPVAATVVENPGRRVTKEVSKFSFLWLSPLPLQTGSDLLQELVDDCGGAVTGVTTAVNTAFAVVGQQERMIVSGYCVDPTSGGEDGER